MFEYIQSAAAARHGGDTAVKLGIARNYPTFPLLIAAEYRPCSRRQRFTSRGMGRCSSKPMNSSPFNSAGSIESTAPEGNRSS